MVLVHAAGAGALSYRPLARCMPRGWHICCVNDLALADESVWVHDSIAAVAREYTRVIRMHLVARGRGESAVVLAGWSYGGVVAIEIARQLHKGAHGSRVANLVLFDAPVTLSRPVLSEEERRRAVDSDVALVRASAR